MGFGLEFALETDQPLKAVGESWPFMILERVANEAVTHERVREGAKMGLFSLAVSGKGLPKSLVNEDGQVGVLLGVESRTLPRQFSTPFGEVRLVTIKALLPTEWEYVLKVGHQPHGPSGFRRLVRAQYLALPELIHDIDTRPG
ncbi:hypothetical protein [Melittangium boletus]|uniref:hypothetical protein n=1 Tax=Melittangium boletus TaxID=83453 RepID=UPI001C54D902|nr:hypothetical protein [Melittangium boletus]